MEQKEFILKEISKFMDTTLSYCEVAYSAGNWKALRGKILRAGNDCLRNVEKEFEEHKPSIIERIIGVKNGR